MNESPRLLIWKKSNRTIVLDRYLPDKREIYGGRHADNSIPIDDPLLSQFHFCLHRELNQELLRLAVVPGAAPIFPVGWRGTLARKVHGFMPLSTPRIWEVSRKQNLFQIGDLLLQILFPRQIASSPLPIIKQRTFSRNAAKASLPHAVLGRLTLKRNPGLLLLTALLLSALLHQMATQRAIPSRMDMNAPKNPPAKRTTPVVQTPVPSPSAALEAQEVNSDAQLSHSVRQTMQHFSGSSKRPPPSPIEKLSDAEALLQRFRDGEEESAFADLLRLAQENPFLPDGLAAQTLVKKLRALRNLRHHVEGSPPTCSVTLHGAFGRVLREEQGIFGTVSVKSQNLAAEVILHCISQLLRSNTIRLEAVHAWLQLLPPKELSSATGKRIAEQLRERSSHLDRDAYALAEFDPRTAKLLQLNAERLRASVGSNPPSSTR